LILTLGTTQILDKCTQAIGAQCDVGAGRGYVHPRNEQLNDPRLLGREQFVPDLGKAVQMFPDLALGQTFECLLGCAPGGNDDLGRLDEKLDLVDDGGLDLGRRNAPDRAAVRDAGTDGVGREIVAIDFAISLIMAIGLSKTPDDKGALDEFLKNAVMVAAR
jgi:hypothetical protein